jgi:hypothetical protein
MKLAVVIGVWVLFVAAGMFVLQKYKNTPGMQIDAPPMWPSDSMLHRVPGSPTLVMLSHPRCPCTRASLAEMETLLSQYRERLTVYILFIQPKGVPYEWTKTDLWRTASRIEGAHVLVDDDAVEADRFKGLTSGHVVLYDAAGRLEFSGGITGARGHIGDNLGLKRVLAVLRGEKTDRDDSPVFGCPLHQGGGS